MSGGARRDASRLATGHHAVDAEVALRRDVADEFVRDHAEGARERAAAASDAEKLRPPHETGGVRVERAGRARLRTGRVLAVPAVHGENGGVADRPGHDLRYAIDPARMRGELGWRPSVTLEEGLRRIETALAEERG